MSKADAVTIVTKPLVIVFEEEGVPVTHIWPSNTCNSHQAYGLIVCDLVRHVARAFKVPEAAVWEWVDRERARPTARIETPKTS